MTGNYSEALEKQVALMAWCNNMPTSVYDALRTESRYELRASVNEAQSIYIANPITELIAMSARTYPNVPLQVDSLPLTNGFAWLEHSTSFSYANVGEPIRAITWMQVQRPEFSGIFVSFWADVAGSRLPYPCSVWEWEFGYGPHGLPSEAPVSEEQTDVRAFMLQLRNFLAALFAFMNQRILVITPQLVERHARKRLEREGWTLEPLVRVVELRRRERTYQVAPVETAERNWQCQWVVRGHWRQQPYPKAGDVRPLWITPYVKGPDDKPLKPPRATVFAVVR